VTEIRDQGHCGDCWAFGTVAAVEGLWAITKKQLVRLEEEELVQCTRGIATDPPPSDGCHGGYKARAFDWIAHNGGLDTEADYPYTSANGTAGSCTVSKIRQKRAATNVASHISLPAGNETALLEAVLRQPEPLRWASPRVHTHSICTPAACTTIQRAAPTSTMSSRWSAWASTPIPTYRFG
jgi:hypothetical protein